MMMNEGSIVAKKKNYQTFDKVISEKTIHPQKVDKDGEATDADTVIKVRLLTNPTMTDFALDIRKFVTSERYTGFTQKGIFLSLNSAIALTEILTDMFSAPTDEMVEAVMQK